MIKTGLWEDNLSEITQPVRLRDPSSKTVALNSGLECSPCSPLYTLLGLKSPHCTYSSSCISLLFCCFDSCFHFLFVPYLKIYLLPGLTIVQAGHQETSIFNFIQIHGFGSRSLSQDTVPFLGQTGAVGAQSP